MERFPLCVIGAGPAGACYIKELLKDWRIDLVGFTNRSADRRHLVASETKVPGYADLASLLRDCPKKPRLAVIATANTTHKDFSLQTMEAGLDVFCEKPMAMTLDDCQAMIACEKRTGRVLQIGFEYRYGTMTGRIKELLDQGFTGPVRSLDITDSRGHWWPESPDTPAKQVWRLNREIGGGPILHCGIHQLDLMRYYGGEIVEVQAYVPPRSFGFYPQDIPDRVTLNVRFASGAAGSFNLFHTIAPTWYRPLAPYTPNYHAVPGHGLDIAISGPNGSLLAEIYKEELHLNRFDVAERETRYLHTESFGHQNGNASHHNTTRMIIDFAQRLAAGQGALQSSADALKTTILGFTCEQAVQEAIESGWASGRIVVP